MTKRNPRVGAESLASGSVSAYHPPAGLRYGPGLAAVGHRRGLPRFNTLESGSPGQKSQSGRAVVLLAVLAVFLVAILGALWIWVSSGSSDDPPPAIDRQAPVEEGATYFDPGGLPVPPRGAGTAGPIEASTPPVDALQDPRRFEGRGSIRGQVVVDPEVEFPERFTVVVGPSRSLLGRERAASRRVEYPGTAEEFQIDDLPLGGYDVWVEAERMNSLRTAVLLTRTAAHPYVILKISPTGFLDGYVTRSDGGPAADVKVTLERVSGEDRREVLTRADGQYRFDDLPDGEYRILFGPPETPLAPPRSLVFTSPSLRFPDVTLPATVSVRIHSLNYQRSAVPGCVISGFGDHGGKIDAVTDSDGTAWAENLPPGRYRVTARADDGRKARTTIEIENQPGQDFWLIVR